MRQPPGKSPVRDRTLLLVSCLLAFRGAVTAQTEAPPDAAEQEQILTLMRRYATSYRMPDVAYEQTIVSSEGRVGSNKWHTVGGSNSNRLAHDGREYWCCASISVGGRTRKPPAHPKWKNAGLFSFSQFEALATKATIVWDHWETLRAHRLAVFNYSVSLKDSEWGLDRAVKRGSDWTLIKSGVYAPYSGSVYVDPATGAVWRITQVITEIPAPVKFISGVADYDEVMIGTRQYLLPVTSSTIIRRDTDRRDEWFFRNYHKFDADSSITFFGADSSITFKE